MKNTMINYSVIIPHKNSSDLLGRCLASIPARSDIEVLVIDDNSNNQKELRACVSQFPSAKLIETKAGKGAGYARNVGLSQAEGKWILFADADDFFNANAFEVLDKYANSEWDIIYFSTNSVYSETLEVAPTRIPTINEGINNRDLDTLKWRVPVVWGKMYSGEMIRQNNLQFDEVLASNDVMFACKASYRAQRCTIDDFALYCSTINKRSLCYSMSMANLDSRVDVRIRVNQFKKEIGKSEYHGNLLNLILYYRQFGLKVFLTKLLYYVKVSSIDQICKDLMISFIKIKDRFLRGKTSGKQGQVVTQKSYYK